MTWFVGMLFALALVVLAPVCWRVGRGVVPRWRRMLAAAALAAATAVPALPVLVAGWSLLHGCVEHAVVPEGLEPGVAGGHEHWFEVVRPDGRPDALTIVILWISLLSVAVQSLRLPPRLGHLQQLPADAALVARIAELAARLGLRRAPRVVETATVGGTMEVQAFAAGMLAPVVVVSDGIVHRLRPEERDAILAHELAHLRHRSVMLYLAATVLVSLLAVLLSGFVPFYVALLWWAGAVRLARTLIGHRDEVKADLAAARCVGFAEVAAALDKIHAALLQTDLTPWFHAVLSHPALPVRAFHLARAAPDGSGARTEVDTMLVQRCMRARRIGVMLWAVLLVAMVLLGVTGQWHAAALVGAVVLVVPMLPYLAFVRELRDTMQISGWIRFHQLKRKTLRFVVMMAPLGACLLVLRWMPRDWRALLPLLPALAVVLFFALAGRRARRTQRELQVALLQRDLAGYQARLGRLRPRQQRQPERRLQSLLVRAALGEREAAVEELQRLQQQWPRFRDAQHWAVILLSRFDPPRAVVLGRALLAALPGNAIVEGTLAAVLRRDGKFDEAWQRIASVLRRRPKHGAWHATAALIALGRGDMPSAAAALANAERLDPGGSITVLARAELDVATGAAGATASVQALRALSEQLPLAFLGDDAARLEGRLATRRATSG